MQCDIYLLYNDKLSKIACLRWTLKKVQISKGFYISLSVMYSNIFEHKALSESIKSVT